MDFRQMEWCDKDWNDLAQDTDQWRASVNTVTNLLIPENVGIFKSN
jgi:hypothetical protein